MNKFLLPLFLIISSLAFGQGTPCLNYQQFGSGTTRTAILGLAQGQKGVTVGRYTDTLTANSSGCADYYPGTLIITDNPLDIVWQRNYNATKWISRGGSGSITNLTMITDSSIKICYADGSCDTIPFNNFTNIVNNLIQNFLDSSVYNINDSTLIICNGAGSCDTIHLGNTYNYYFLNDSSLVTCDTLETICVGDSCYTQQICDTIPIPRITTIIYQNLLRPVPFTSNIIEGGSAQGDSRGSLFHDTWYYLQGYQWNIEGATSNRPPVAMLNYAPAQVGSSLISYRHYGAYAPGWGLLDQNNPVKLYINYTDPYGIPPSGVLSGDTIGPMGNRYGYMIMTNSNGGAYHYDIDDINAKQVGIFFDTYTQNNEGVTIFAGQVPATYSLFSNPPTDSTLLTKRVAIFKTNGQVQFPQYTIGAFPITSPLYIIAQDANGDLYQFPPGGFSGGGGTSGLILQANNGLSIYQDTIVQLGGPIGSPSALLNDRYISHGAFQILHTGSISGSGLLDVQNANAFGYGIYAFGNSGGIIGQTTNGVGAQGTASGGIGVEGLTTGNGTGVYGWSNGTGGGIAGLFRVNDETTNNVATIVQVKRTTTLSTPAAGIGGSIDFITTTSTGSSQISNTISSQWSTATHGTRTSKFIITGVNSTTPQNLMTLAGSGQLTLDQYTTSNFNGGAAADSVLVVTSAGVVKKRNASAFGITGITADNGLTASTSTNVQLGATAAGANSPLLHDTWINTSTNRLTVAGDKDRMFWVESASGRTAYFYGNDGNYVVNIINGNTGGGLLVSADDGGLPAILTAQASSTNTVIPVLQLNRETSGTGATGLGGSLQFTLETSTTAGQLSNELKSSWVNGTHATRTSQLVITGVNSGTTVNRFIVNGDGTLQIVPITATAASAITPAEGMLVFVSNTDATFTSIGPWMYYNGAWHAL